MALKKGSARRTVSRATKKSRGGSQDAVTQALENFKAKEKAKGRKVDTRTLSRLTRELQATIRRQNRRKKS